MDTPRLFLSAGDPSGDNAAGRMLKQLRTLIPEFELCGLGAARLAEQGQVQFAPAERLAVLGFWEVARQYRFFKSLMNKCVEEIHARRPDCIVLVDYPGFNLRLAKRVRSLGIPIIYYISPQLWAWGKKRIEQVRQLVDRMMVILPFEEEFYRQRQVAAEFVGHYLMEDIPPEMITSEPPSPGKLALLPGSRRQEILRHLDPMVGAAQTLHQRWGVKTQIAGIRDRYDYENAIRDQPQAAVEIVYDKPRQVIQEASVVVCASGTATLETAIIGRPMVVVYRTGWLTHAIARRLVKLDTIALANLVLGERVVPELIQGEVTATKIVETVNRYWTSPECYGKTLHSLRRTPEVLGGTGASERAARIVAEYLGRDAAGTAC